VQYNLPINYETLDRNQRREVREQYILQQRGICFFCQKPLYGPVAKHVREAKINWKLFPPNFSKFPVHLQHDHQTGMTEGAVHSLCNAYMWQYLGK